MAKSRRDQDSPRSRRPMDDAAKPRKKSRPIDDDDDDRPDVAIRKKKKSTTSTTTVIFRIIGSLAGVAAVFVLLYWIYSPVGIDSALLCYAPKETVSVVGGDIEELTKNPKITELMNIILQNYKSVNEGRFTNTGLTEKDVQKFLNVQAASSEDERDLEPQQRRGSLSIVRFKLPVDQDKFKASFSTSQYKMQEVTGRDGKQYYQLYRDVQTGADRHLERVYDYSFFFPNSRTLVYATTKRELEEAMNRTPGRVELEGNIRELANKVDGHFFRAHLDFKIFGATVTNPSMGMGFMDSDLQTPSPTIAVGSANWFASDGNYFLYADGIMLTGDRQQVKDIVRRTSDAYEKISREIWQSESGGGSNFGDPFGLSSPGTAQGGTKNETKKDLLEGLSDYIKYSNVYRRGNMMVIEGRIWHEKFEKMWKVINAKYNNASSAGRMGMGGMMMPGGR